ncbi:CRISPR-associated protein Cas4 [Thermococcus aciditolerans]|uniref:Nuclease n=1 Tax=Thermococcus aciditolerans TaxID=2598455 RepID=A0A5C0SJC3_9EURY|nr:nuclease [Thermococcus aciditolerans]QEK14513.1 nuclease [Thermococcus aciditolerans]
MDYPTEISEFNERIRSAVSGKPPLERRIWVTSLSHCLRKTALSIYLNTYNPSKSWEARIGSALHGWLGEVVKGAEFEVPVEYKLGNGWSLVGKADAVKGDYILEFKFKGFEKKGDAESKSRNKKNQDLDHAEPSKEWVEQLNAYLGMLGKERGYIYIFDRNGLEFRIFPVDFDEKLFRRFIKRAERVIEAVEELETGKFPKWIGTVGNRNWVCNSCIFRPICASIDREWLKPK